jgi:hypothetical protein
MRNKKRERGSIGAQGERLNLNVRHLTYGNPNGIKIGTWMGHGDHGVVGTMDPRGDGDVMASYEVRVTRVCFTCRPLRGMLLEWARGIFPPSLSLGLGLPALL